MKIYAYAVYDKAVKAYMQPMFFRAQGEALRSFSDAVNKEGQFNAHMADYSLHYLGSWNDQDGLFDNVSVDKAFAVEAVAVAMSVVEKKDS